MSDASETFDRVRDLTHRVLEGEATDAERDELRQWLEDESARRVYVETADEHARLLAEHAMPAPKIVAERITYERVELDAAGTSIAPPPVLSEHRPAPALPGPAPRRRLSPWFLAAQFALLALLVAAFLWMRKPTHEPVGRLVEGAGRTPAGAAFGPGDPLPRGARLHFEESAVVAFDSGHRAEIAAGTHLASDASHDWILQSGRLKVTPQTPRRNLLGRVGGAALHSRKGGFEASFDGAAPARLAVRDGSVEVLPDARQPRHFWPMDEVREGRIGDRTGRALGRLGPRAEPTEGLVGTGAIRFDNTPQAFIALGSGGGQALATGSFAMDKAISIEALFTSSWSGRTAAQQDEADAEIIFRKQDPKGLIMLLQMKHYQLYPLADPPGDYHGPVIVFGLYLIGPGYGELTVQLDGKDGRPTFEEVTNGQTHHVVATYDSRSGVKRLYFNGRAIAEHRYTPGSRILSGGPGQAHIGNMPVRHNEPFTGVIDEVAVYDYPLTPWVVGRHHERAARGVTYFEQDADGAPVDRFSIEAGQNVRLDPIHGLPIDAAPAP